MLCTYHSLTIEISSGAHPSRDSDLLSERKTQKERENSICYRQRCRNTTMTNFNGNIRNGATPSRLFAWANFKPRVSFPHRLLDGQIIVKRDIFPSQNVENNKNKCLNARSFFSIDLFIMRT